MQNASTATWSLLQTVWGPAFFGLVSPIMKVPAGMGTIPGLHVCFATGAGCADGAALGERLGAGFAHAAKPSPATIVPTRIRVRMVGKMP